MEHHTVSPRPHAGTGGPRRRNGHIRQADRRSSTPRRKQRVRPAKTRSPPRMIPVAPRHRGHGPHHAPSTTPGLPSDLGGHPSRRSSRRRRAGRPPTSSCRTAAVRQPAPPPSAPQEDNGSSASRGDDADHGRHAKRTTLTGGGTVTGTVSSREPRQSGCGRTAADSSRGISMP